MRKLLVAAALASLAGLSAPPAMAQSQPVIPVIVKDTTSFYWQIVLAGARKAGQDLKVKVPELGAQSESDITGQIGILENAVSQKPAAIVIAPTQFAGLGKPIDAAAKQVKIIGIDSGADSKAFTSFLTTDNVQGGRVGADGLAAAIAAKYGKAEGDVALITSLPGVGSLDQRAKGFKEQLAAKYPGLKLTMDHLSIPSGKKDAEAFKDLDLLLAIAKRPNVAAKVSALPCYSTAKYPYTELHGHIRRAYDAFGPQRLFWGSDQSRSPIPYRQQVTMFTEEIPWLTASDKDWIMGRGVCEWLGWKV